MTIEKDLVCEESIGVEGENGGRPEMSFQLKVLPERTVDINLNDI